VSTKQSYGNGVCNVSACCGNVVKRRETDLTNRIFIIFGHISKWSDAPFGNALLLDDCESNYS